MRFLIDENIDSALANHLHGQGHDIWVADSDYPPALQDIEVLALAQGDGRILVTYDRDFGRLVFVDRQPHAGVIHLRLADLPTPDAIRLLDAALEFYEGHIGGYCVVTPGGVRLRRE